MIITKNTPSLDLHGEISSMVEALITEFINDNIKLKNEVILIIHGKSTNILTKKTHLILKNNKNVKEFKLDNWNLGQTIVVLNI